jgi:hypothetical protein
MTKIYEVVNGKKGVVVALATTFREGINKARALKTTTGKSYIVS